MILVCGEALMDLIVGAGTSTAVDARPGGSPFNVAVGIARLGVAAGFLGGVSTDHFGDVLMRTLAAEGIDAALVHRSPWPTPLVVVAAGADGQPSYAFHAHDTADGDVGTIPAALPASVTTIALGSFAVAAEPAATAFLALVARESGRRVISLDPNLRPARVGPIAEWRARFDAVARHATIIKLSEEDFAGGWGDLADAASAARGWLADGARLVVMTRGAAGATLWWSNGAVSRPGRAVPVVDTVGAGDSFHAALLARLMARGRLDLAALAALDRAEVVDAADFAVTAAALTCTRRGADLPRRAEVDAVHAG